MIFYKELTILVKVYTMDSCSWCVKAKEYLKSKNVDFVELNVQTDMEARQEMVKNTRQMRVPVININGTFLVGFNEEAIDTELNK